MPLRLVHLALALALATPAAAQTPAPVLPLSAIPATAAGAVLREWFAAFNTGDSATYDSFLRKYGSQLGSFTPMAFRRETGGFDLISIERSEPRRIEFLVRERHGATTALGELSIEGMPPRITGPRLQALGPHMPASAARIDASDRARVVARAAALLDSFYVFPDVARRMGDTIRAQLARGAYDGYSSGPFLAARLASDLRAVSRDKHLDVRFSARPLPPLPPLTLAPPPQSPEELARARRQASESNCAFQKVERMEGNIGYLKFNAFHPADLCEGTVAAAMSFVAGTRALIIDLRENGGGQPAMVALITSYLFDRRTHLNDLYTRYADRTDSYHTRDSVEGRRFGGEKPVYVLTSSRSFSGAEEFSYNLKALKRATIVGETTGGGAHPVRPWPIDDHFFIGLPFARAINPITRTNWEGTGVDPDVKVPAAQALETALRMLREAARP